MYHSSKKPTFLTYHEICRILDAKNPQSTIFLSVGSLILTLINNYEKADLSFVPGGIIGDGVMICKWDTEIMHTERTFVSKQDHEVLVNLLKFLRAN